MKHLPEFFWLWLLGYYGFFMTYSSWDIQLEILFMVTAPFVLGYLTGRKK